MATIPRFSRAAVRTGADGDCQILLLYALHRRFLYLTCDTRCTLAWQEVYDVDGVDL